MRLKVLAKTENELRLEIEDEGHTFCNALQDALLKDEGVEIAGYNIPHPLVRKAVFQVRTIGGKDPLSALAGAAERLASDAEAFKASFEGAYEEWLRSRKRPKA